jgi:diguanylate cyclase (GGDEF)-like protein
MLGLQALFDQPLLAVALAFGLSAAQFWLASTLRLLVRQRSGLPSATSASAASVALLGVAIWWPGHLLSAERSLTSLQSVVPAGLAILMAGSARFATVLATSRSAPGMFFGAAALTFGFAMSHGMVVTPAAFGALGKFAPGALGLLMAVLVGSLLVLQFERENDARPGKLRAGAALCAAATLTLTAWTSGANRAVGTGIAWPETVTMAALLLVALALVRAVRYASSSVTDEAPIQRNVPSIDSLTKLPTRVDFEDRLAAQVAGADATKSRLALLFIDLDGFKPVNDTFGHSTGDMVLMQVGERLRSISRSVDVLTRIGGDEFVLLAAGNPTQEAIAIVAKRLIDEVSRPYDIGDREVVISCSIGIVLYPDSGGHTKLIARADAAMYEAKRSGGGCYCFYTPAMDQDSRDKFELVSELRQAIDNNQLELFYQPKIDAHSGKVTAAEALLRWKHPKRGMVPPAVFIPLAERFGLIGELGDWVIDDACRQVQRWHKGGLRMRVAVNLSALQMRQADVVDRIVGALRRHKVNPALLTCEITESVAMEDTKATQQTFRRLAQAGIHLSIDDFGTGYSSLSYLRRLPAEELKIDRAFVTDIETSADARSVVDAVIKLAHALGLRVVAEGVENESQQTILTTMGCDELQGYLFAKPMTARALLLWAMDDPPETSAFRASLFSDTAVASGL